MYVKTVDRLFYLIDDKMNELKSFYIGSHAAM